MKNRIFFKLLAAFLIVIAAAAVIFDITLRNAWQDSLRADIERNLEQKTTMFAHRVDAGGSLSLAEIAAREGQAAGARATIIDSSGKVLADSQSNLTNLAGLAQRPEFAAALAGKIGTDERRSPTVSILYVAAPISGGAVRLAYPLSDVEAVSAEVRGRLILASALAFIVALFVAALASAATARRLEHIVDVAAHIADGDLRARVEDSSPDEIGRLVARSTKPRVRSSAASPLCAPASASSKLCSTACRTRSSQSAPMDSCNGPISGWIASFRNALACRHPSLRPSAIPISLPR